MANIYIDQLSKNNKMIDLIKIPNGYKGNKWFYLQDYLLQIIIYNLLFINLTKSSL